MTSVMAGIGLIAAIVAIVWGLFQDQPGWMIFVIALTVALVFAAFGLFLDEAWIRARATLGAVLH